jgi:hypothetical protein
MPPLESKEQKVPRREIEKQYMDRLFVYKL